VGLAVLVVSLLAGCGEDHRQGAARNSVERNAVAWPEAMAVRQARRASLVVDGRQPKVDPASIVCWGVGHSEVRGDTRVWRRFHCIAPTFRGAEAGPDVLFVLRPTGRRTFSIIDERLSSY
jgi:hypothetical protein